MAMLNYYHKHKTLQIVDQWNQYIPNNFIVKGCDYIESKL